MVNPLAVARPLNEINIFSHDANSVFYDMPYGLLNIENHESERIIKPASVLECGFMALDRITSIESPKLSAGLSAESKMIQKKALQVKRAITSEMLDFSRALPDEDNLSQMTSDIVDVYRSLHKEEATTLLETTKKMLSMGEKSLRSLHLANGAHESFPEFIATAKKIVIQCERFIASSSYTTLYDDMFSRSILVQNQIIERHIASLDIDGIEAKKEGFIETHGSHVDISKFDVRTNIVRRFYDGILYERCGLKFTGIFQKLDESAKGINEQIAKLIKASGMRDEVIASRLKGLEEATPLKLVEFLKENGPFAALGYYGSSRYLEAPNPYVSMPTLGDRDVFAWKKGAARSEKLDFAHCVTIVAARALSADTGLVFFVDPTDKSDPSDHKSERVFVISFQNFLENNKGAIFNPTAGLVARA